MKLFRKNTGKHIRSSAWGTGLLFLGIFGATAATTYFVLPQHVVVEKDKMTNNGANEPAPLTGRDKLIANMADGAAKGMEITIDGFEFQFADKDGNLDANVIKTPNPKDGEGQYIVDQSGHYASGERAFVDFAMESLSLHGIKLAANLPVEYNGKHRQLAVGLFDEHAYLNLLNLDSESEEDAWDLKYKVSLKKTDIISAAAIDPITGGVPYYEYGDLDWLLDDVLTILTDGGIQGLDFGVLISSIKDKMSAPAENENEEENDSSLLDSLSEMEEIRDHYFVWNLPLGEKTLPLGFRASGDDYHFAGVDFPAITGESQDFFALKENEAGDPTMAIKASASINLLHSNQETFNFAAQMPGDLSEYRDLRNSKALFETVANLAAKPEASFGLNLDIVNDKEQVEGSRTVLAKNAVNDGLRIEVDGDFKSDITANLAENEKFNFDFSGVSADVNISQIAPNDNFTAWNVVNGTTHNVKAKYLKGQMSEKGGEPYQDYDAYLNLNGILEAKTTKLYLDELMGSLFAEEEAAPSDPEQAEENNTLDQIAEFLPSLGNAVKAITDSDFVKGLGKGIYDSALNFIESIEGGDSNLTVRLTFAPIGLEGKAVLEIAANELVNLKLIGIKFLSFTVNGELSLNLADIASIAMPENYASLKPLSHVYGLKEQIESIVDSKSFEATVEGHISASEENVVDADGLETTGLDLEAKAAFDLNEEKEGTLAVKMMQRKPNYYQQHNIALDVYDDFGKAAIHYDSKNEPGTPHSTNPKNENGISARLGFESLLDFIKPSLNGITGVDSRFSRLISSLSKESSTNLLGDITSGNYFSLLSLQASKYVKPIEIGTDSLIIELHGNEFGLPLESTIKITAKFNEAMTSTTEKGLSALIVDVDYEDDNGVAHAMDFSVTGIKKLDESSSTSSLDKAETEADERESFTDISSVGELGAYAIGTVSGVRYIEEQDPENPEEIIKTPVTGLSYYGIRGDVGLELAGYDINVYGFDAYASVEGAETKALVSLHDIPVIRGVNGPDSSTYFRPNELEGVRDTDIYYYANGINAKGEYLITRDSSYGKVRNVYDAMRFSGEAMNENPLGYLVQYGLGVLDEFFEDSGESASSSSSSSKAIHFEDAYLHYAYNESADHPVWSISMNLGELLGISPLGEVNLEIAGQKVSQTAQDETVSHYKTLTNVDAGLEIALVGHDQEGEVTNNMHVAHASVSLALTNVNNGAVENVWLAAPQYAANFVGEVDDSGILDNESKGYLYEAARSDNATVTQTNVEADHYFVDWKVETLKVQENEEIVERQITRQMMYYPLSYGGAVGCLYL